MYLACSGWDVRYWANVRSGLRWRTTGRFQTDIQHPLPSAERGPYLAPLKGKLHELGRTRVTPSGERPSPPWRPLHPQGPSKANPLSAQLVLAAGGRNWGRNAARIRRPGSGDSSGGEDRQTLLDLSRGDDRRPLGD